MHWSGLSTVAVRIAGLAIFTNALVIIAKVSQSLAQVFLLLVLKENPLHDYLSVLLPFLPTIVFLCLGLFLFLKARWMTSMLGRPEMDPAQESELSKLESVLIGVAGLYFTAEGAAELAQVLAGFVSSSFEHWTTYWELGQARYLGIALAATAKIVIGLVFVLKRAGLARLVEKAEGRPR
jgi:hypothetical protein